MATDDLPALLRLAREEWIYATPLAGNAEIPKSVARALLDFVEAEHRAGGGDPDAQCDYQLAKDALVEALRKALWEVVRG